MHEPEDIDQVADLRAELQRLRDIIDLNTDWIWEVDEDGRYTYSSSVGPRLLGYPVEQILGRTPLDFMLPDEADRVGHVFLHKVAQREHFSGLINRNLRADGSIVVLETSGVPLYDESGRFKGYRGIDRDVTALWTRHFQLEAIYASAPLPLFVVDRDLRFVVANENMARLCGRPADSLIGRMIGEFMPRAAVGGERLFARLDSGRSIADSEIEWNERDYIVSVQPVRDMAGGVVGATLALMDVTKRKRAEAALADANRQLEVYADHDYLTGLINRRRLAELLKQEIRRSHRDRLPLSLIMGDVDFFKRFNDRYGHLAGDDCLRMISLVLSNNLQRASDIAGRYGGEEFVVILPGTDQSGALHVAEMLRAAIEAQQLPHEDSPLGHVTMSFGVATLEAGSAAEPGVSSDLLHAADVALYRAKNAGRNRVGCHAQ
ncbi:diguanylate cyclase (GGDEF) domain protein [compost metagenome]